MNAHDGAPKTRPRGNGARSRRGAAAAPIGRIELASLAKPARTAQISNEWTPTLGHLELRIWLRLLSCTAEIEKILRARLRREFNTTLSRFDVLAQLERFPDGLIMTELSRRLMVSNGAITGLVDKLVAEGVVQRHGNPSDKRATIVRLTARGRETFLAMARRHEEWVVSILGELSREAQTELLQSLTLLKRNLDLHVGG